VVAIALPFVVGPVVGPAAGAATTLVVGGTLKLWQEQLKFRQGPLPFPPVTGRELEPTLREMLQDFAAGARVPVGFPSPPPMPDFGSLVAIAAAAGLLAKRFAQQTSWMWGVFNGRPEWQPPNAPRPRWWPEGEWNPYGWNIARVELNGAKPAQGSQEGTFLCSNYVSVTTGLNNIPFPPGTGLEYTEFLGNGQICEGQPNWNRVEILRSNQPWPLEPIGLVDNGVLLTSNWNEINVKIKFSYQEDGPYVQPYPDPWKPPASFVAIAPINRPLGRINAPAAAPIEAATAPALVPVLPAAVPIPATPVYPLRWPSTAPAPSTAPEPLPDPTAPEPAVAPVPAPQDPRLPAAVGTVPIPKLPPLIRPVPRPVRRTTPDGRPQTQPQAAPITTKPGAHVVGTQVIPDNGPRPDLVAIASEVGRLEQKTARILRDGPQAMPPNLGDLAGLVQQVIQALAGLNDQGSYSLGGPCERDEQGNAIPFAETVETWEWGGSPFVLQNIAQRVDVLAEMMQKAQLLRQPTCKNPPPVGELVSVQFREVDP
jgi:hypothetical protein